MYNPFQSPSRNRRRAGGFRLFAATGGADSPRPRRAWWLRPGLFLLLLAAAGWGGNFAFRFALDHWLYQIDSLALSQVIVTRDGVLTEDEIRRLAGVQSHRNVLTLDTYALRQRLRRHPRVEDATVRLELLPNTLRLAVRERVPVARVLLPPAADAQGCFLLDESGHVLLPFERGHAPNEIIEAEAALPLLNGLPAITFAAGQAVTDAHVLAALKLVAGFDSSPMAGVTEPISVDVSAPGVLVVLSTQGARVTLAGEDFDRQLREWRAVHDRSVALGRAIGTLDLSVRGNSPLKWLEAGTVPAGEAIPKPVRSKRKSTRHV